MSDVVVEVRRLPLRLPFRTALRSTSVVEPVRITVRAADGVFGIGETVAVPQVTGDTTAGVEAALRGPLGCGLIGLDAADIVGALDRLDRVLPGNRAAKAAVDLALHDLVARVAGWPLVRLLGGPVGPVATDLTVAAGDIVETTGRAREALQAGFGTVKIKVGAEPEEDVARVRSVWNELRGRARLRVDANQGWTPGQAVRILTQLADSGVELDLAEQPVAATDLRGLRFVRQRSPVPILADETVHTAADVLRVAHAEAADLVNVKLVKAGGLRAALQVAAVARTAGLGVLVGSMMEASCGVRAAAALAAVVAPEAVHDLDAAWWLSAESEPGQLSYRDGLLTVDQPA